MIPRVEPEGMLIRKPASTPDQVRGRLFRDHARAGSSAAELYGAKRHGDRRLGWIDHRDAERLLQRAAMARHAGTAHHQRLSAILLLQSAPDIDHALERLFAACRLGDRHLEWTFTGEAIGEPHLQEITLVPRHRALA